MNAAGERAIVEFAEPHDFSVIPLHCAIPGGGCTCRNPQCSHPGKHPREREWTQRGRDVREALAQFRQAYGSNFNIGVLTGPASGVLVIDVDPKSGGLETLASWVEEHGPLPKTLTVLTGRFGDVRGKHLYFRYPDFPMGNKVGTLGDGIDVRGKGGMVVAPGSLHKSGVIYECEDIEAPVSELPEWLADKLKTESTSKEGKPERRGKTEKASPRQETVGEGGRNDFLFRRAIWFLKAGTQPEGLLERLQEENTTVCNPPLDEEELERIAEGAVRYADAFGDGDLGNARRFTRDHGENVRFVEKWGKFFVWNGRHWQVDEDGAVERMAKQTVTKLKIDALDEEDPAKRKLKLRQAAVAANRPRIRAMIDLAKTEEAIAARPSDFDRDPFLLTVSNGTIDLRSGLLRPHRREDLITRMAGAAYDPSAKCPEFERFVASICGGDEGLVRYLQKVTGYSLTGSIIDQSWFLLYGVGSNGKSTLLDVLRLLLGDYARMIPTSTLLAKKGDSASNDVAMLKGLRLVTAAESEAGRYLAEGLIKQITGGDELSARFLFQEYFSFVAECKIFFATNHRPKIKGNDDGTWRRMRAIPFAQQFRDPREYPQTPEHLQKDPNLREKLVKELSGILAWAVKGCLLWQEEGLVPPAIVAAATAEYRAEMDVLAAFLDDACIVGKKERCLASELYQAFHTWCEENGEQVRTHRDFSRDLMDRGFEKRRSGKTGSVEYYGVRPRRSGVEGLADVQQPGGDALRVLSLNTAR